MDKIHQVRSYMRSSRTRKPQKPLVRKNRDRVPLTKCSGATFLGFEGQSMNKQNEKQIMKREITQ